MTGKIQDVPADSLVL